MAVYPSAQTQVADWIGAGNQPWMDSDCQSEKNEEKNVARESRLQGQPRYFEEGHPLWHWLEQRFQTQCSCELVR